MKKRNTYRIALLFICLSVETHLLRNVCNMGLPQLERCCCFFDLKTGNIILGSISAFLSFVLMVTMICISVEYGSLESAVSQEVEIFQDLEEVEEDAKLSGVYAMSIILVLMFLAKFAFDVFFIYGVVMERAGIIKAYFIMWVVFFILSMFVFFLNCYAYNYGTIFTVLVYLGINVYAILISHSFYRQLNMREEV